MLENVIDPLKTVGCWTSIYVFKRIKRHICV